MIEVRLLGPVEVRDDEGRRLPLGGSRPVALLSALVVHLGEVLSTARLVDLVWEDSAPATAGALVATHVAAVRRALAPAGAAPMIRTRAPGYLADLAPGQVDASRFERLLAAGRRASDEGRDGEALDLFTDALALWHGQDALEGLTQSFARIEAARLNELRLVTQEHLYALRLRLRQDTEVVAPLLAHVAAHPLRERPRAQLMTALLRAGRAPDALRVFQEGCDILRTDLGLDPGPELRALHLAALRNDPALAVGPAGATGAAATTGGPGRTPRGPVRPVDSHVTTPAAAAGPGSPSTRNPTTTGPTTTGPTTTSPTTTSPATTSPAVSLAVGSRTVSPPSHLPPDVADFVGRTRQVGWVTTLLGRARDTARTAPPIAVISGRPGMGKTTLAVHAAHRAAHLFPDGRLFLDLRASDTAPLTTTDALTRLLRALGVDPGAGAGPDDLLGLYRSRLAGRRILLILDNAPSEARLRPLVPPGPGSAVLITSRRRLTALEGAVRLDLSVPDPGEALRLLTTVAGRPRPEPGPGDLDEIVSLCGQLPLALRIAGARLAARPHWTPGQLAGRLRDERGRLNELRAGDLEVRASLELGYAELDPPERRALRRLALMDLPDFAAWIAAPLLDIDTAEAEEAVERLVDCHLIEAVGTDGTGENRYRIHDLVREHARERCLAEEAPAERRRAVRRLVACWLALADRAAVEGPGGVSWLLPPPRPEYRLDPRVQDRLLPRPAAWFAAEQGCLVAAVHHCAAQGMTRDARELAGALIASSAALYNRFDVWAQTHTVALDAVRREGDGEGEPWLLLGLGQLRYEQDRFEEAYTLLDRARRLFDAPAPATDDTACPRGTAAPPDRTAGSPDGTGRDALRGSATALVAIGTIRREQARFGEASEALAAALERYRTIGDDAGTAHTLYGIGYVHREQGRGDQAREVLSRSLALFRRLGDRQGEAITLRSIALCERARGALTEATGLLTEALRVFTAIGDTFGLMYTEQALAKVELRQGLLDPADQRLDRCLTVARERRDRFGEALVLRTRGEWHLAAGDPDAAEAPLREALALWERLALPLWRARTLRDLAEVHAAHGDRPGAELARRQAHSAFLAFGSREAWEERD
ncbi:BTAD domain-containing putative transcriptional regulator [Kitasatospora sp. NPDC127059]|uniref:AfsR/SARP family transcriptional regulator n=1 Tax=unclassified Kitasatospora TaxID=2633591 RepID=UPI00364C37F9